ncbi:MAG: flagellar export chaperone FliS [Nitrospinaceae bacterium]
MIPSNYHKEYQKNEVATSHKGKLVLMMYDGAIKFTRMAIQHLDSNDIAKRGIYIRKTQDIINELSLALNMDKGGEISHKLESLYRFTLQQLTLANIKSDREALEGVLKILGPLREAWEQVFLPQAQDPEKENPTSPALPGSPKSFTA